jgi:diguanylate cyclase
MVFLMTKVYVQAQRAIDLLIEFDVSPTPSNYEFAYHYVLKTDLMMVSALDEHIKSGKKITEDTISRLRRQHFGNQDSDNVGLIVDQTNIQIDRLASVIENAGGDARSFACTLRDGIASAEPGKDGAPEAMINQVVKATAAMVERTHKLEAQLAMSAQEVQVLRRDLEKARTESRTDPLTGLPNRKAFQSYIEAQAVRAVSEAQSLSLLFCDIDHFKVFNDSWGHRMGDEVLRLVGQAIEQLSHGVGYPARYGGEEFVIVLPNRKLENAREVAERIREFVSQKALRAKLSNQSIGRVTLSFGVAELSGNETVEGFIERADSALYRAKEAGRNRVVVDVPKLEISKVA